MCVCVCVCVCVQAYLCARVCTYGGGVVNMDWNNSLISSFKTDLRFAKFGHCQRDRAHFECFLAESQ